MRVGDNFLVGLRRRTADESGSMVIALLAVIVASGLMISMTAYAFQGHRSVRFDRDHTRVIQGADAGVNETLFRLAMQPAESVPQPSPHPPLTQITTAVPLTAWKSLGDYQYRYQVDPWPAGQSAVWKVESYGRITNVDRTVERHVRAIISQPRPFTLAAFADDRLQFNGGNRADSYTQAAWGGGGGIVGSNGSITLNGGSVTLDDVEIHDFAANPTGRCTSNGNAYCSTADYFNPEKDLTSESALGFITEGIDQYCPAPPATAPAYGGQLLGPGKHCFSTMPFPAAVDHTATTASNPAIVYLTGTTGQATITVPNKGRVNCPTCSGTNGPRPEASRLQIYTKSAEDVRIGNHSHFAGVIYAPRASCRGNPSNAQAHFYGSLVCATITNQGGWNFHFDERLRDIGAGGHDIIRWSEE